MAEDTEEPVSNDDTTMNPVKASPRNTTNEVEHSIHGDDVNAVAGGHTEDTRQQYTMEVDSSKQSHQNCFQGTIEEVQTLVDDASVPRSRIRTLQELFTTNESTRGDSITILRYDPEDEWGQQRVQEIEIQDDNLEAAESKNSEGAIEGENVDIDEETYSFVETFGKVTSGLNGTEWPHTSSQLGLKTGKEELGNDEDKCEDWLELHQSTSMVLGKSCRPTAEAHIPDSLEDKLINLGWKIGKALLTPKYEEKQHGVSQKEATTPMSIDVMNNKAEKSCASLNESVGNRNQLILDQGEQLTLNHRDTNGANAVRCVSDVTELRKCSLQSTIVPTGRCGIDVDTNYKLRVVDREFQVPEQKILHPRTVHHEDEEGLEEKKCDSEYLHQSSETIIEAVMSNNEELKKREKYPPKQFYVILIEKESLDGTKNKYNGTTDVVMKVIEVKANSDLQGKVAVVQQRNIGDDPKDLVSSKIENETVDENDSQKVGRDYAYAYDQNNMIAEIETNLELLTVDEKIQEVNRQFTDELHKLEKEHQRKFKDMASKMVARNREMMIRLDESQAEVEVLKEEHKQMRRKYREVTQLQGNHRQKDTASYHEKLEDSETTLDRKMGGREVKRHSTDRTKSLGVRQDEQVMSIGDIKSKIVEVEAEKSPIRSMAKQKNLEQKKSTQGNIPWSENKQKGNSLVGKDNDMQINLLLSANEVDQSDSQAEDESKAPKLAKAKCFVADAAEQQLTDVDEKGEYSSNSEKNAEVEITAEKNSIDNMNNESIAKESNDRQAVKITEENDGQISDAVNTAHSPTGEANRSHSGIQRMGDKTDEEVDESSRAATQNYRKNEVLAKSPKTKQQRRHQINSRFPHEIGEMDTSPQKLEARENEAIHTPDVYAEGDADLDDISGMTKSEETGFEVHTVRGWQQGPVVEHAVPVERESLPTTPLSLDEHSATNGGIEELKGLPGTQRKITTELANNDPDASKNQQEVDATRSECDKGIAANRETDEWKDNTVVADDHNDVLEHQKTLQNNIADGHTAKSGLGKKQRVATLWNEPCDQDVSSPNNEYTGGRLNGLKVELPGIPRKIPGADAETHNTNNPGGTVALKNRQTDTMRYERDQRTASNAASSETKKIVGEVGAKEVQEEPRALKKSPKNYRSTPKNEQEDITPGPPRLQSGKIETNTTLHKEQKIQSSASSTNLSTTETVVTSATERGNEWTRQACVGINHLRKLFDCHVVTIILQLLIVCFFMPCVNAGGLCQSPQQLRLGSTGVVNCASQDFPIVSWFNSTNTLQDHPLVTTNINHKSGHGYLSGEFDIAENGSLIIWNVSLQHEHEFCVVTLTDPDAALTTHCADVVIVVLPEKRKPFITNVHNCSENVCFARYFEDSVIRCSVENARPAANLSWAIRSGFTDQTVSPQSSRVPSSTVSGAFSSYITLVNPFMYSKTLALAVCKAKSQPNVLNQTESLLLLQNMSSDLHRVASGPLFAAVKSTVVLHCPQMETNLLVWNWKSKDSRHMAMVAYAVFSESLFVSPSNEKLSLNPDGSLVISDISIESRGTYICLTGDGQHEESRSYDVDVYAPAFPEVEGCRPGGYCVLLAEEHDRLTCVIRGVPEGVRLGLKPLSPQQASITFLEQVVEIRHAGDFVDVSVTATYDISGSGVSTFQCGVIGEQEGLFSHTAVFSLYVEPAIGTTAPMSTLVEPNGWKTALIIIVAVITVGFLLWIGCTIGVRIKGKETIAKRPDTVPRQLSNGSYHDDSRSDV